MATNWDLIDLELFRKGDPTEQKKVYTALKKLLIAFLKKEIRSDSDREELYLQTIADIWKSLYSSRNKKHLQNLAYRAVKYNLKDFYKKQSRRPPEILVDPEYYDNFPARASNASQMVLDTELAEKLNHWIKQAVKKLGIEHLESTRALMLHLEGNDTSEIAQTMGITSRTAINHKNIAIAKLREYALQNGFRLPFLLISVILSIS
jgi:RNA polymerase sigma factor (sigma-70 family)